MPSLGGLTHGEDARSFPLAPKPCHKSTEEEVRAGHFAEMRPAHSVRKKWIGHEEGSHAANDREHQSYSEGCFRTRESHHPHQEQAERNKHRSAHKQLQHHDGLCSWQRLGCVKIANKGKNNSSR